MLPLLRAMTKRARCAEQELESKAGKREKLIYHDLFAATFVQAQARSSNSEQEEDDAPGEEAQAAQAHVQSAGEQEESEEDATGEEAYLEYSDTGIDDAASEEDESSSEDMYTQNSSEVDDDEEEYYDDYSFQSQEDYSSRSASSYLAPGKLTRIADLHPGLTGHWQTRGRVAHKRSVRRYNNQTGAGTYFFFEMADEHGGEIRVVCFDDLVEEFFDKVRKGEWVVVSNGRLQAPNPRFNQDGRACEVLLMWNSSIRGDSTRDVVKETTESSGRFGSKKAGCERSSLEKEGSGILDVEKEGLRREVAELRKEVDQYKAMLEEL